MNPKLIIIDGKTYHSTDEMPAEVRQRYEQAMHSLGDKNQNGIPDAFEALNILADTDGDGAPDILENILAGQPFVNSMKIIANGKEFNGIEDLPPEVRARYEEAMSRVDSNRNGIPDFAEGPINSVNQIPDPLTSFGFETLRHSTPLPSGRTITPDTSSGWMLVLTGLFIFVLCAAGAAGIWFFFLR
jgi:hypothetical protein